MPIFIEAIGPWEPRETLKFSGSKLLLQTVEKANSFSGQRLSVNTAGKCT